MCLGGPASRLDPISVRPDEEGWRRAQVLEARVGITDFTQVIDLKGQDNSMPHSIPHDLPHPTRMVGSHLRNASAIAII
jgi:hypothetical protein